MKINICDVCYKMKDGKMTRSERRARITHHSEMTVDYCNECRPLIPRNDTEFVRFCFKLNGDDLKQSDKEIRATYLTPHRIR